MSPTRCLAALVLALTTAVSARAGLYYSGEAIAELPAQWRGFLLDQRALRQIRHQLLQRLEELQHPQSAEQQRKVGTVARLDPLHRALGDAGFLGKLRLGQSRINAARLETVAEFTQNRRVCQVRYDFHNSPIWTTFGVSLEILV